MISTGPPAGPVVEAVEAVEAAAAVDADAGPGDVAP
jgi:hypothetical protein